MKKRTKLLYLLIIFFMIVFFILSSIVFNNILGFLFGLLFLGMISLFFYLIHLSLNGKL